MTDGSLDHFYVTVAPLLKPFIQVNKSFADSGGILVFAVNCEQHILNALVGLIAYGDIAAQNFSRNTVTAA